MIQEQVLLLGGTDSSGGAGLSADVRALCALGVGHRCAITAVTAQGSGGVEEVQAIDPFLVERQVQLAFASGSIGCVKIGMLATRTTVELVARALATSARSVPIVLDPVLSSTSGLSLLEVQGHGALVERLLPMCALITPNAHEAEALTGLPVENEAQLHAACEQLLLMGQDAVLIKGGHVSGDVVVDVLRTADGLERRFEHARQSVSVRGTGCTLASAVAGGLAEGLTLEHAVVRAEELVQRGIALCSTQPDGPAVFPPRWGLA